MSDKLTLGPNTFCVLFDFVLLSKVSMGNFWAATPQTPRPGIRYTYRMPTTLEFTTGCFWPSAKTPDVWGSHVRHSTSCLRRSTNRAELCCHSDAEIQYVLPTCRTAHRGSQERSICDPWDWEAKTKDHKLQFV